MHAGFGEVAGAAAQWKVARNFSAVLQLVNAGNVGIERGPWMSHRSSHAMSSHDDVGHSFMLRLLCLAPVTHGLANFKAPSLVQAQVSHPFWVFRAKNQQEHSSTCQWHLSRLSQPRTSKSHSTEATQAFPEGCAASDVVVGGQTCKAGWGIRSMV